MISSSLLWVILTLALVIVSLAFLAIVYVVVAVVFALPITLVARWTDTRRHGRSQGVAALRSMMCPAP